MGSFAAQLIDLNYRMGEQIAFGTAGKVERERRNFGVEQHAVPNITCALK